MNPGETSLPAASMRASAWPVQAEPAWTTRSSSKTTLPRSWTSCVLPLKATTQPFSMCVRISRRLLPARAYTRSTMTSEPRLRAGLRVLGAASFIAGPVATTAMADFGADVIKIEPPGGDTYRVRNAGYPPSPYNFPWIVDNRNKRGLALDLRTEDGRHVLHQLVRQADVFVTNVPLDGRARLGVRWEDLSPLNPRLIYGSITAYGEDGEEASRPGFDSTALWARTGLMDLVRPSPEAPPARSLPGMGDHPTGTALFGAIMAALYQRERTGDRKSVV